MIADAYYYYNKLISSGFFLPSLGLHILDKVVSRNLAVKDIENLVSIFLDKYDVLSKDMQEQFRKIYTDYVSKFNIKLDWEVKIIGD